MSRYNRVIFIIGLMLLSFAYGVQSSSSFESNRMGTYRCDSCCRVRSSSRGSSSSFVDQGCVDFCFKNDGQCGSYMQFRRGCSSKSSFRSSTVLDRDCLAFCVKSENLPDCASVYNRAKSSCSRRKCSRGHCYTRLDRTCIPHELSRLLEQKFERV
ncbi:hypothetical protein PCE1_001822 [Barthelona sp. PCE]